MLRVMSVYLLVWYFLLFQHLEVELYDTAC